jgi:glucokinase
VSPAERAVVSSADGPERRVRIPAVGIDVGGTKFAAGLVDESGRLASYTEYPLPSKRYEDIVALVGETVGEFRREVAAPAAVGVAVAGWLSPDRDVVLQAANLGWRDQPLRRDLEARTGLAAVVGNDADCAAWAEWVQAGKPGGAFALLTLGTDVGGGLVINGELITGAHGLAAELGHLTVRMDGAPCVCGSRGCLAVYASGTAMLARAKELLAADPSSAPTLGRLSGGNPAGLTGAHLQEAVALRDPAALAVVGEAGRAIAAASQQISRVIDHAELMLGGGASNVGQPLVEAVSAAIAVSQPVGPVRPIPRVRLARTGNRAGVLGAADLASRAARCPQPT